MNKIIVIGRLTKDPEIKELDNGNKVANITLAIVREYKDKDGNKITDFLSYSLWNKLAEKICQISKKGSLVCLEGYMTDRVIEINDEKIHVQNPVIEKYINIINKKDYSSNLTEIDENLEIAK